MPQIATNADLTQFGFEPQKHTKVDKMNRVQFLMQGLEINEVQASLVSELIKDIQNDKLKDFFGVFVCSFIDQYKSKELITKEALL